MKSFRWQFMVCAAALLLGGCTGTGQGLTARPTVTWPDQPRHPEPFGSIRVPQPTDPGPGATPPSAPFPRNTVAIGPLRVIPRSRWASKPPVASRLRAMNGIARITVHHEGWKPVWFTDQPTTARRLERIRVSHLERLKAGDLGYHFVIDRAGTVWEGRPLKYQGAHVKSHNEHNLGIMVLGDFERQRPTAAQVATLTDTLARLARYYRVPASRIHTHQELGHTDCPGKYLQPTVERIRREMAGAAR
jgi:hypothetical protein